MTDIQIGSLVKYHAVIGGPDDGHEWTVVETTRCAERPGEPVRLSSARIECAELGRNGLRKVVSGEHLTLAAEPAAPAPTYEESLRKIDESIERTRPQREAFDRECEKLMPPAAESNTGAGGVSVAEMCAAIAEVRSEYRPFNRKLNAAIATLRDHERLVAECARLREDLRILTSGVIVQSAEGRQE